MFRKGSSYTRQEISVAVGGGLQDCISHSNGRVVAICVRPEMNPESPLVLLVGKGRDKQHYSKILCTKQRNDSIPVFTRKGRNSWEFEGNFRVKKSSVDSGIIAEHEKTSGRTDVQMVIHFVEV
jgi:hypothetical protein